MKTIIDIRKIRYLNLFERITNLRGRDCFFYNNIVFFAVNPRDIFKAIGKNSENLKKLSGVIGKKIRIISYPSSIEDAPKFILQIITPLELKEITVNGKEILIDAGSRESKALLMGREKRKLEELSDIIKSFFGCEIKVM
jgi:N utilization substance protein A